MGGEEAVNFSVHLESSGDSTPKDIWIVPCCNKFELPITLHLGRYKVPQKLFYLSLFLYFDMWVPINGSKPRLSAMLLQSCRISAPNKKYSVCRDTQSALIKLLLLGTHEVPVNYSNQPMSKNLPSKQMAATAGSKENTGFFMMCGCWQHFKTISRPSKRLSVLSFLSEGDMPALIYVWDRLPFTTENLPLIYNWFTLNTCRAFLPWAVMWWFLNACSYSSFLR